MTALRHRGRPPIELSESFDMAEHGTIAVAAKALGVDPGTASRMILAYWRLGWARVSGEVARPSCPWITRRCGRPPIEIDEDFNMAGHTTIQSAAKAAGVSPGTLSKWIRGRWERKWVRI